MRGTLPSKKYKEIVNSEKKGLFKVKEGWKRRWKEEEQFVLCLLSHEEKRGGDR